MARLKDETHVDKPLEEARQRELDERRKKARHIARIVARLPEDRDLVPVSDTGHELLSVFGMTAYTQAKWGMEPMDLLFDTAGVLMTRWLRPEGGSFNENGFYSPSGDEMDAICRDEYAQAVEWAKTQPPCRTDLAAVPEPVCIGPTWQRSVTDPTTFALPGRP
jgi:hypothetical protein